MRNILFAFVTSLLILSCGDKKDIKSDPATSDAIPVKIAPIAGDTNQNIIHASGLLSTEDEARLSFKIGGIIDNITVKEGQFVKKGQLLATLKSTEIAAQVSQVQFAVQKAQRDYQRALNLYDDSVATLEQLQNAKTGLEIEKQNLQQVSFNQQYSRIYATSDGFVVKKLLNVGELASSGSSVLIIDAVSSTSKWVLDIGVADKEWAAIEKGNKALVTVDAFPGKQFDAVVSKKDLAADPVSGSFQIELQVNFDGKQPAVGMFGNAAITPSRPTIGFAIPYEALLEADGKKGFVFVTDDQQKVHKEEVSIASMDNKYVYLKSGLHGYKYVVISGSPYLSDGASIAVVK